MEGKASQSGTVSGPAAAKREVRRMIRERVGGLDAAAREAMSRSICRRVSSLVREKNFRRVPGPGCPELHAGEMDLIVLPGAAFTRDGKRLGYGGGFYDTLLTGPAAGVPLAGVCFPCQLLDDLPMEAHDRHVDMVTSPEKGKEARYGTGVSARSVYKTGRSGR